MYVQVLAGGTLGRYGDVVEVSDEPSNEFHQTAKAWIEGGKAVEGQVDEDGEFIPGRPAAAKASNVRKSAAGAGDGSDDGTNQGG